jgi:hypothetical protein
MTQGVRCGKGPPLSTQADVLPSHRNPRHTARLEATMKVAMTLHTIRPDLSAADARLGAGSVAQPDATKDLARKHKALRAQPNGAIGFWLAAVVAPCLTFAPAAADARSDQAVVMECTRSTFPGFRETIALDVAAKTVSITVITPINGMPPLRQELPPGRVTQVSDQQISFSITYPSVPSTTSYVLNRYTGDLHSSGVVPVPFAYEDVCQRQQKQF